MASISPIWGVTVMTVEPGTVILRYRPDGTMDSAVVDDKTVVFNDNRLYATASIVAALSAKTISKQ